MSQIELIRLLESMGFNFDHPSRHARYFSVVNGTEKLSIRVRKTAPYGVDFKITTHGEHDDNQWVVNNYNDTNRNVHHYILEMAQQFITKNHTQPSVTSYIEPVAHVKTEQTQENIALPSDFTTEKSITFDDLLDFEQPLILEMSVESEIPCKAEQNVAKKDLGYIEFDDFLDFERRLEPVVVEPEHITHKPQRPSRESGGLCGLLMFALGIGIG